MPDNIEKALREELEQFKKEKEEIRHLIGQIGGKNSEKNDKAINTMFIIAIFLVFLIDILRHFLGINISLPPLFSLEVGVLLVSVKIIWMIHKQAKVEHFQFWILNSIEFRLNDIAKKLTKTEAGNK